MSGYLPHFSEIHYTDDIGATTNTWVVNQKLKNSIWAQTDNKKFNTRCMPVVKKSSGVNLKGVEFFSKNSKWESVHNKWDENNPKWGEISELENSKYNKNDIMFLYESSPKFYNLKYNTSSKPFTANINVVDEFNIQKFLPVVMVQYYKMVDSNDDYITHTTTPTSSRVDLKTYLDLKTASGLSDEEFYKRYPIFLFDLVGYYGNAGERENIKDNVGSYNFIGFGVQRENDKTIELLYRNFTGGLNATNNNSFSIQSRLTQQFIDRTTGTDGYTTCVPTLNATYMYFGTNSRACYPFYFSEFKIAPDESLFDENNEPIVTTYKTNDIWEIPTVVYPTLSGANEGIRISPYFTYEYIMSYVALFGIYYTTDSTLIQENITDPYNISQGVFLGHMDNNGWTDGTYAEGTAIRDFDSANKQIGDIGNTPYNPNSTPTNTDNLANDTFSTNVQYASFSRKYLLTGTQLNNLYSVINNSTDFKQKDGMQYFVSLQIIPQIFAENCICNTEIIKFGDFPDINIVADHVDGSRVDYAIGLIDVADFDVPQRYNNFLDFYPYTRHKMYLPYIGTVDLPPDLAGKHLNIKYSWDIENGNCTAYITVSTDTGESVFATYSGNVYGDIVVTANNADIKQIKQALSLLGSVNSIFNSGTSLNPFAVIGAGISGMQTMSDLDSKGYFHSKSSQGDFNNFHAPQYCKLITQYMYVDDFSPFEKSTGYNCNKWAKLSDVHGHTVVQNANLGSSFMTIDEVEELNRLLETGVELP